MTLARPVFRGDTVHIQRRTRDGRFFLVPKPETLTLVRYAYGLAAERFGLTLHSLCVMSTHVHVIATDPEALHPRFTEYAHRLIALGLKRMYGIEGSVWKEGGASVQRMIVSAALVEAMAYVRINPVAAGCVRFESAYPGVFGADEEAPLEEYTEIIERPTCFGPRSELPAQVSFVLKTPAWLLDELDETGAARAISDAIRRHRDDAWRERATSRGGFLGMRRVLSIDVWTRAGELARSTLRPTFKGVVAEAIRVGRETLVSFRIAYAVASAAFRGGARDVVFPQGTYLMRIRGCIAAPCDG